MQRYKDNLRALRRFIRDDPPESSTLVQVTGFLYNSAMNNALAWRVQVGKGNTWVTMVRDSRYSKAVASRDGVVIATTEEAREATARMLNSNRNLCTRLFLEHYLKNENNYRHEDNAVVVRKPSRLRGSQKRMFIEMLAEKLTPSGYSAMQVDEGEHKYTIKYS